jgi:chaperone BCS1
MKELINYTTTHQLEKMFQRFYPDEAESQASFFSQKVLSYGKDVSAAQVQGLFLMYKHSPDQALNNLHFLWTS